MALTVLRLQSANFHPWMPTRATLSKIEDELPDELSNEQKKAIFDQAISWAPLEWELYLGRGSFGLDHPDIENRSDADFDRALFLEQNSIELPTGIGDLCMQRDFPEAMKAWREILRRQTADYKRDQFFTTMDYKSLDAKQRYEVTTLAGDDPQLQAVSIIAFGAPEFQWYLQKLLDKNPSLDGISPQALRWLFNHWASAGDVDQFVQQWQLHPTWQKAGWRAYAYILNKNGHVRDAVLTALQFIDEKQMPELPASANLDQAAAQFHANPTDIYSGLKLYSVQEGLGLKTEAINTLQTLSTIPKCPSFVSYILAKDLLDAGQDAAAWQALQPILNE